LVNKYLLQEIQKVSLSMFNKNFFGVYHGSISARTSTNTFVINKKEAIFDEMNEESLIHLNTLSKDYRWNIASMDTHIHEHIYQEIPQAKYICYAMPPYATAYALKHDTLTPIDYFGSRHLDTMSIYDPRSFGDWYSRAPYEITNFFRNSTAQIILIKGFGLFAYDRDIRELAKRIALLENSARLMILSNSA